MIKESSVRVIDINHKNIANYPPSCFMQTDSDGYKKKLKWIKKEFRNGLKIKLLYREQSDKCIGFIEYIPSEYAWRGVKAKNYLFIHCIWVSGDNNKRKGYGSLLIRQVLEDAQKEKKAGVIAMSSNGPFMASKDLYKKLGFKIVDSKKPSYDLLVKSFRKAGTVRFQKSTLNLSRYKGLNIIYSNQCPWVARGIKGMTEIAKEYNCPVKVYEIRNAQKAQNAPSVYATFNLIYNGKLLADHYISHHHFRNLLDKELGNNESEN